MAAPPAGAQMAAAAEPDVEVVSLHAALAESESQLASARDAIFALSTGRRVLVQEVLELRALLAGQGSQRQYDSLATRDAALEKLEAREAQVRELQVTVKELQGQLHRQQLALRVGHELSREAARVAEEQGEAVELAEQQAHEMREAARAAQAAARAEASQRRSLEGAMAEQQRRAQRRVAQGRQAALDASAAQLHEALGGGGVGGGAAGASGGVSGAGADGGGASAGPSVGGSPATPASAQTPERRRARQQAAAEQR